MDFEINTDDYVEQLSEILISKNMVDSAFLCRLMLSHDEKDIDAFVFLKDEAFRLMDLLSAMGRLGLLQKEKYDDRDLNIIVPLLRVVLEGQFKVDFLFCTCVAQKNLDLNLLNQQMSVLINNYLREYESFRKELGEISEIALEELEDKGKKITIPSMLEHTENALFDKGSDQYKARYYVYYRYACFFSHNNMNKGVMRGAEITRFIGIDINDLINTIARNYAAYIGMCVSDQTQYMKIMKKEVVDKRKI